MQNGDDVDPTLHYEPPLQMLPTPQGLSHFVMRLEYPRKNLDAVEVAPAAGRGAIGSAISRTERSSGTGRETSRRWLPQDIGRSRTMAFAADST